MISLKPVSEKEIAIWYGDENEGGLAEIIPATRAAVDRWIVETFGAESAPSDYFLHHDLTIRNVEGHYVLLDLVDRSIDAHNEK